MLYRVRNAIPQLDLVATPSFMPISFGRQRVMLYRLRNAVVHAHRSATPSRQALWCAEGDHLSKRVAQHLVAADALRATRSGAF
jgi:hypothetical protein